MAPRRYHLHRKRPEKRYLRHRQAKQIRLLLSTSIQPGETQQCSSTRSCAAVPRHPHLWLASKNTTSIKSSAKIKDLRTRTVPGPIRSLRFSQCNKRAETTLRSLIWLAWTRWASPRTGTSSSSPTRSLPLWRHNRDRRMVKLPWHSAEIAKVRKRCNNQSMRSRLGHSCKWSSFKFLISFQASLKFNWTNGFWQDHSIWMLPITKL